MYLGSGYSRRRLPTRRGRHAGARPRRLVPTRECDGPGRARRFGPAAHLHRHSRRTIRESTKFLKFSNSVYTESAYRVPYYRCYCRPLLPRADQTVASGPESGC